MHPVKLGVLVPLQLTYRAGTGLPLMADYQMKVIEIDIRSLKMVRCCETY
jgi:hypothetical protein